MTQLLREGAPLSGPGQSAPAMFKRTKDLYRTYRDLRDADFTRRRAAWWGFGLWALLPDRWQPQLYTTKSGRILTDVDLEILAKEAERGYDVLPPAREQ